MLNTRKNYVSLYSQAPLPRHNNKKRREKKLFYTRKNGFERNSTRKLCVPKNHLHHINCISSTPPPAPSHPKSYSRLCAQGKRKASRNLSVLFWWHRNMKKVVCTTKWKKKAAEYINFGVITNHEISYRLAKWITGVAVVFRSQHYH